MPWLEEIVNVLENASVGVAGATIFAGSRAIIPAGAGPFLSVRETGGTKPLKTQETTGSHVAYQEPGAQVVVRGADEVFTRAMTVNAYNALLAVRNQTILGTWYLWINALQEPIDLGLDGQQRIKLAFNIMGRKRPS